MKNKNITLNDFKELFQMSEITDLFKETYENYNFHYDLLPDSELEEIIQEVTSDIEADTQKIEVLERKLVWNKGWSESLEKFEQTKTLASLVPKYIRPSIFIRYKHTFIKPHDPQFELNMVKMIQIFLFETYFKKYQNIYEFGCGSGLNVAMLCSMFPNKTVYAQDFVDPSIKLMQSIKNEFHFNIKATLFDFANPDYNFILKKCSAVLTMGALEQVPKNFKKFIDYLLINKPEICIHSEPILEVYDLNNRIDRLAYNFHIKRGYTTDLLIYLKTLEKEGKLKILNVIKSPFGSKFIEGYTFIIWRSL